MSPSTPHCRLCGTSYTTRDMPMRSMTPRSRPSPSMHYPILITTHIANKGAKEGHATQHPSVSWMSAQNTGERAFPSLMMFWVFVVNICETNCVRKCFGLKQVCAEDGYQPLKRRKIVLEALVFCFYVIGIHTIKTGCSMERFGCSHLLAQNQCTHLAIISFNVGENLWKLAFEHSMLSSNFLVNSDQRLWYANTGVFYHPPSPC
jgi:hypothetical protein